MVDQLMPPVVRTDFSPPSPARPSAAPNDLRRLLAKLRRRRDVFVGVGLAVLLGAGAFVIYAPRLYTATAQVELQTVPDRTLTLAQTADQPPASQNAADNEVEVLKSRFLAQSVADALPERARAALLGPATPKHASPVAGLLRSIGAAPPSDAAAQTLSPTDQLVSVLQRRLKVSRAGLTNVIDVAYQAPDPGLAALVANVFVTRYVEEQIAAKNARSEQAARWLSTRLQGMQGPVQQAEANVENYRAEHGLLSASGETLTEQVISSLSTQLAQAETEQATAEARLAAARRQLSAGSKGDDVSEALSSTVIQTLRSQRAEVSRNLAAMQDRYGSKHPEIIKARRQLEDIDDQISAEIGRVTSSLSAQADVARTRTASLQASLGRARAELASSSRASVGLKELQRRAEATQAPYASYLERFRQAVAQQGVEQPDARVLSRAMPPSFPSSPDVRQVLMVAVILAMGAGFGAVALFELFDDGFSTSKDVETLLDLPSLASIPTLSSTVGRSVRSATTPTRYVTDQPLSAFTEAFRNLRASIHSISRSAPARVVAVTSSLPAEGKTTTAVCLGKVLAVSGQSVVIVECDVRRPSLRRFVAPAGKGLLSVLEGSARLEEALVPDEGTPLVFLPIAHGERAEGEPLLGPALDDLIEDLKARFDVVLLDTPPVLPLADTRMLACKADAVLYLVRWRKTGKQAVELGLAQLAMAGARVFGVALTRVDLRRQARTGYGDAEYYYGSYKQYYKI